MNSVGMENPGIQHFIDCDLERMNALDLVNIVNMGGHSEEDYLEGVELLNQHPLDLLELNISFSKTGFRRFRSMAMAWKVLVRETPSAPSSSQTRARATTSSALGEILGFTPSATAFGGGSSLKEGA